MHRSRVHRGGGVGAVASTKRDRGTGTDWYIGANGYVVREEYDEASVRTRRRRLVKQHREVMEQLLGRPIREDENVHHKNGIRHDNRPENLELWATTQPSGQRVSDLLAYAHTIIQRYEGSNAA